MCTVKVEVGEAKAVIGGVQSECGERDMLRPGANIDQVDSEPSTPKKPTQTLPKRIEEEEEEENDPLTYLLELFRHATLDGSEDSDGSECDSEDESVPASPRPKGFNKYCFYASGRLYYFDDYRNLYSDDGTLVSDGAMNFQADDLLTPSFHIEGVPYWFDMNGLFSQGVDGTVDRVHVWQSDPEPFDLGQVFDSGFQTELATFQYERTPELDYGSSPSPPAPLVTSGEYSSPKAKSEILSPPNTQPLQQTLQGRIHFPWSPTSSTKSPIVHVASRESSIGFTSDGPTLFPDSQAGILSGVQIVSKWHQDTAQAQKDAITARPVRKASKEERRRCPTCNKTFRRPSSLDDHLNVHTGDKPHTCPFKGCNTGFATKSNMKRHFLTHRVGQLERYRPGLTSSEAYEPCATKSGKAPRAATSTYNSKAHHTLRFRVAA